jgi:hypothetical protein
MCFWARSKKYDKQDQQGKAVFNKKTIFTCSLCVSDPQTISWQLSASVSRLLLPLSKAIHARNAKVTSLQYALSNYLQSK